MVGAGLAVIGLIHGNAVHVFTDKSIALGYALGGVTCVAMCLLRVPQRIPDPEDPADIEAAREAGYMFTQPRRDSEGALIDSPAEKEPAPA